jgi:hypothetical protein
LCILPISVRTGESRILLLFDTAERRSRCLPRNFGMMWADDIKMDNKDIVLKHVQCVRIMNSSGLAYCQCLVCLELRRSSSPLSIYCCTVFHIPLTKFTSPKRLSLPRGVKCWSLPAFELCDMLEDWRGI